MVKLYSHLWSENEFVFRVLYLSPKERTFTTNSNHITGQAMEKNPVLPLCDSSSAKTMKWSLWKPWTFTSLWGKMGGKYVQRNIEFRLCNNCCCRKAV